MAEMLAATATTGTSSGMDSAQSPPLPVSSDKSIVPAASASPVAPAPATKDLDLGPRVAYFSTDFGRRQKRAAAAALPPPIARNGINKDDVVKCAQYWQKKYPELSRSFLPGCCTIEDLWDDHDIRVEGHRFLEEVLTFLTRENFHWAIAVAKNWPREFQNRCQLIADIPNLDFYNNDNVDEIVHMVFVNGETNRYPALFLWHCLNIMRTGGYLLPGAQQQPAGNAFEVEQGSEAPSSSEATIVPTANLATGLGQSAASKAPIETAPAHETESSQATPAQQFPNTRYQPVPAPPISSLQLPQSTPSLLNQTVSPFLPLRPPQSHRSGWMSGQGSAVGSPSMHHSTAGAVVGGPSRSASGSYGPALPTQPRNFQGGRWLENIPSGHHPRQPPGPPMQSPPYHPGVMPQPVNMMGPMGGMSPYQQHPVPAMHPMTMGQMNIPTIMHPSIGHPPMAQQPVGYHLPDHMQQGYGQSHFPSGRQEFRSISIGDMTNAPYPNQLQRTDPNATTHRRMSRTDRQPELFNPYSDNPEFAQLPPHFNRKGARRNSASNNGRNRRYSTGFQNRGPPGSYNQDQSNNGFNQSTGRHGNHPYAAGPSSGPSVQPGPAYPPMQRANSQSIQQPQFDPLTINDPELSCGETWIGPKNTGARSLYVIGFARETQSSELSNWFETATGTNNLTVHIKDDVKGNVFAIVYFTNVADTRRGLAAGSRTFQGRPLTVKVAKHHYQPHVYHRRLELDESFCLVDSNSSSQPLRTSAAPETPTAYSPQDARSDLPRLPLQGTTVMTGSPEVRKAKQKSETQERASHNADNDTNTTVAGLSQGHELEEGVPSSASKHADHPVEPAEPAGGGLLDEQSMSGLSSRGGEVQVQPTNLPAVEEPWVGLFKEATAQASGDGQTPLTPIDEVAEQSDDLIVAVRQPAVAKAVASSQSASIEEVSGTDDTYGGGWELADLDEAVLQHDLDSTNAVSPNQGQPPSKSTDDPAHKVVPEGVVESTAQTLAQPAPQDSGHQEEHIDQSVCTIAREVSSEEPATATNEASLTIASSSGKEPAATEKRSGAKQTESLNPFALQKQQDRERKAAMKKEKKKAKAEKKAAPTKFSACGVGKKGKPASLQDVGGALSNEDAPDTPGAECTSEDVPGIITTSEPDDPTSGNSYSLDTSNSLPQTYNAHTASTNQAGEAVPILEAGPGQVSSEPDSDFAFSVVSGTSSAHIERASSITTAPASESSKKKVMVAVPDPILLRKSSSSRTGHGTNPVINPHPASSEISRTLIHPNDTGVPFLDQIESTQSLHTQVHVTDTETGLVFVGGEDTLDTASVASSTTYVGTPSPALDSPSPTSAAFHTPLQTPSGLAEFPELEPARKSKPKSKKKKRKSPAVPKSLPAGGPEDPVADGGAFSEQMAHLDAIKSSYYNSSRDNEPFPDEEEGEGGKEGKEGKV
ncbi:hypothetical protein EJ04DRAFT_102317 [Polyplosphaeria fusca]|uniref:RRM domain-containing protein n=1 Tax=Polyplosphaeria fusca TaxID=682080 RepID=A0A9P4R159_9PLEO|nr:hypothetical protein EJ04DRAFT_102317 [Polyplosphaeria fusca]